MNNVLLNIIVEFKTYWHYNIKSRILCIRLKIKLGVYILFAIISPNVPTIPDVPILRLHTNYFNIILLYNKNPILYKTGHVGNCCVMGGSLRLPKLSPNTTYETSILFMKFQIVESRT